MFTATKKAKNNQGKYIYYVLNWNVVENDIFFEFFLILQKTQIINIQFLIISRIKKLNIKIKFLGT